MRVELVVPILVSAVGCNIDSEILFTMVAYLGTSVSSFILPGAGEL